MQHATDAILDRGVGNKLVTHLVEVLLLEQQNARPGIPSDVFQIRLVVVEETAQALTGGSGQMLDQLIRVRERALAESRDA